MGGGTFVPPRNRSIVSARLAFQRHRAPNIGAVSRASRRTSSTVSECRNSNTVSSGNACCSLSEITIPLSVAAACSSKLKVRQNRLRSASPHARLMREPNGACRISCIPPDSSKNRSATTVSTDGSAPSDSTPRGRLRKPRARLPGVHRFTHARDSSGQLHRPSRRLAQPERNRRLRAMRVLHPHLPLPHMPHAPRLRAQQEHIARKALDREVFVDRAHHLAFRLCNHRVGRAFRNRPARRNRRQLCPSPATQTAVDLI